MAPSSESSDYSSRKRMRKGTHSCLECRRRKIRCIYEPNAATCNRCTTKQLCCTEQEYGDAKALGADKRKSMRERTSKLEGMITQILTKLDSNTSTTGPQVQDAENKAAEALRSLRSELLPSTTLGADVLVQDSTGLASPSSAKSDMANEISRHYQYPPLLSLFDNSVLSKGNELHEVDIREASNNSHQPVADKHRRVLSALKPLTPSIDDIGVILRTSRQSLHIWQDKMRNCTNEPLDNYDDDEFERTQDFIHGSLHSDNISTVAVTFACLALTMQQIPGTFDSSQLSLPAKPDALRDYYITAVETWMASDDGLASTIDGLSVLIVQTKYYVNLGKPRKGWLTIRRALNFAQMLGFHRQSYHGQDAATTSRKSIWLTIFQIERFLSLLLGYPSACLDAHYVSLLGGDPKDGSLDPQRFAVNLSIITGQIINRNQDPNSMTVAVTLKIDQDLEDTRKILSSEWWNTAPGPEVGVGDVFDTFIAKTFFHNVRMLLHLPFMLKSNTDRRYEYSKIAALESSREMIGSYHCLRHPLRPLVAVCNVIDFQVFTSAMLLIINLLGIGNTETPDASGSDHDSSDWDLIYCLMRDLKKAVKGEESHGNNGVAAQALTVLEDLVKARSCDEGRAPNDTYQAVIPYFGKIRIRWGKGSRPHRASSSATTTPGLPSMSNPHQLPTPSNSCGTPICNDPQLSFDNYFQPLPGDMQPWQDQSIDWNAMNDFELLNDWNWFANAPDQQLPDGAPMFAT